MNVDYREISCADAARMIGVDYSTVAGWCRADKVNHANVCDGDKNGRYVLNEDEVNYIKHLKQKFGKQFIRKYRKDWKKGTTPAESKTEVVEQKQKPVAKIKSVVTNITVEEPASKPKFDADNIAATISYIQDIKDRLRDLEIEKNQLTAELEELRKEVMEYL